MKFKLSSIVLPGNKSATFILANKKRQLKKTFTFSDTHPNFLLALQWLQNIRYTSLYQEKQKVTEAEADALEKLHNIYLALKDWSNGDLKITRQSATYKGRPIDKKLEALLLKVYLANPLENATFTAWSKYLEAATNPNTSHKVANRLFMFLQQNDLTITEDGKVLAWKVVRPNYKDIHSGTFDNSPGQTVEIDRKDVDDNDNNYCSYGLHVCSWGYLSSFASRGNPVLQVELDIADIISIPLDYNGEKIRVCKYKVLRDVGKWDVDVDRNTLPKDLGFKAKL